MTKEELKERTKLFALRILKLARALPNTDEGRIIRKQIIRSGTSVGANYRAVCRSRSSQEFISKLSIVIEEADETVFWLELIIESKILKKDLVLLLLGEANELTAIFVSSAKTAKRILNHKS